jgi:outer membrane lipoprotein SlyB
MDNTNPNTLSSGHAGRGLPRAVWVGGALMGLTIVALATALVVKSHGNDATGANGPAPLAAASAPLDVAPAAGPDAASAPVAVAAAQPNESTQAPAVVPAPVPVPIHASHRTRPTPDHTTTDHPAAAGGGTSVANEPARDDRQAAVACATCGVVASVTPIEVQGETNGIGAVAGGVGGALIGSKIAGRGNHTLGGVLGAVGGGLLGNTIEKHERRTTVYDVHVRMEDGSMRTVRQAHAPAVGEHVYVEGHTLRARTEQG